MIFKFNVKNFIIFIINCVNLTTRSRLSYFYRRGSSYVVVDFYRFLWTFWVHLFSSHLSGSLPVTTGIGKYGQMKVGVENSDGFQCREYPPSTILTSTDPPPPPFILFGFGRYTALPCPLLTCKQRTYIPMYIHTHVCTLLIQGFGRLPIWWVEMINLLFRASLLLRLS